MRKSKNDKTFLETNFQPLLCLDLLLCINWFPNVLRQNFHLILLRFFFLS